MKITEFQIEKIIPYAGNPRKNAAAVDKVAASIKEYGWRQPIVVDGEMVIIAGHTRYLAAQKLGLKKVPVHVAADLDPLKVKAYRLADNRTHEEAEWDSEALALELKMLLSDDYDLSLMGFDDDELSQLFKEAVADGVDDDIPEPPATPVSVLGDVWMMGGHRVRCGDSTSADDVTALLNGVTPHLMVTDPPYGVEYDANWRNEADRKNGKPYGARAIGKVENDDRADWSEAWALFPGAVAYVWHAYINAHAAADSLIACGFDLRAQIIWAKSNFAIGRGHYHPKHESCWYAVRKGKTGHWCGDRKQTTVWDIAKPQKSETGHSTQKPVECMKRPIENNSSPGQAVYDPFLGSGTTVIAAEIAGRVCYGMELSPAYVDAIVGRWQQHTGKEAVHADTGKTFDKMKRERLGGSE